jgi:hypothetical protein
LHEPQAADQQRHERGFECFGHRFFLLSLAHISFSVLLVRGQEIFLGIFSKIFPRRMIPLSRFTFHDIRDPTDYYQSWG